MANIAVINPYVTDFKLYDEWMHPLGLYFLITALKKSGHEVYYYNCLEQSDTSPDRKYSTGLFDSIEIEHPDLYSGINRKYKRYGRPQAEFTGFLKSIPPPDFICLGSGMTYWAEGVIYTAEIIREFFPDPPIVIGGIAAHLIPDYFTSRVSNCFIGGSLFNSEHSVLPVNSSLSGSDSFLAALPLSIRPHAPLLLSLGCPLQCSYCASRVLQPAFIQRPIETVTSELDYFVNSRNITDFAFYDDALLYKPENVLIPLLDYIKSRNYHIRLHTPNGLHLRFTESKLIKRLFDAGFRTLRFGFESSSGKHSKDTCGKVRLDEFRNKIGMIIDCGFIPKDIGIYIMAGLPDQSPQDVIDDMEFVNSLGIQAKPVFLSPVPHTPIFNSYIEQFPKLKTDPLWHNDVFFITQLRGWDAYKVELIRLMARSMNAAYSGSGAADMRRSLTSEARDFSKN